MRDRDVVYFGRAKDCQINLGRVPYDDRVPSVWGRITWNRRVRVENLAERVARWSFSLHPTFAPEATSDESPCVVAPGMECSLSNPQFEIRAIAPGGLATEYSIRVLAHQVRRPIVLETEVPSVVEIALSPAEKTIGRALVRPLEEDSAVPATYAEIGSRTNYSREGARDAIERIDGKLAAAGLYSPSSGGKTPDRVARILLRHRHLLR